jgi:hypothetical protein
MIWGRAGKDDGVVRLSAFNGADETLRVIGTHSEER